MQPFSRSVRFFPILQGRTTRGPGNFTWLNALWGCVKPFPSFPGLIIVVKPTALSNVAPRMIICLHTARCPACNYPTQLRPCSDCLAGAARIEAANWKSSQIPGSFDGLILAVLHSSAPESEPIPHCGPAANATTYGVTVSEEAIRFRLC